MALALPYTFINGTVASASQVNANFTALANQPQTLQSEVLAWQNAPSGAREGNDAFTVAQLTLTPGDWTVWGVIGYRATVTHQQHWEWCINAFIDSDANGWGDDLSWNEHRIMDAGRMIMVESIPAITQRLQLTVPRAYFLRGYQWWYVAAPADFTMTELQYKCRFTARRFGDAAVGLAAIAEPDVAGRRETILTQRRMMPPSS